MLLPFNWEPGLGIGMRKRQAGAGCPGVGMETCCLPHRAARPCASPVQGLRCAGGHWDTLGPGEPRDGEALAAANACKEHLHPAAGGLSQWGAHNGVMHKQGGVCSSSPSAVIRRSVPLQTVSSKLDQGNNRKAGNALQWLPIVFHLLGELEV